MDQLSHLVSLSVYGSS